MKSFMKSATESFAGNSVGRFIYLQGPENALDVPTEAEVREAAIRQTTLDQLAHHALSEAIAKHEMGRYDIMEGPEGVFRINENTGAVQVYVDGWGNNNKYLNVLEARDLQNGVTAQEILEALQGAPEIEAILNPPAIVSRRDRIPRVSVAGVIALGEGDDVGAERIQVGETGDEETDGIPVGEGDGPEDETIPVGEEGVETSPEVAAPSVAAIMEAYRDAPNKGGILTQVNDAMGYVRGTPDRIQRIANAQTRLENDEALRRAFGEALGLVTAAVEAEEVEVDEDPATEAPEVEPGVATGAEISAAQAQELIDSLEGLTGRDLQNRINELATQLGLTFPEGNYVENGLLKIDGSVGRTTREAQQQVIETLRQNIPVEADHYLNVLDNLENPTDVDAIVEAIRGNQVLTRLLQRDLKLLGFYNAGIDGVFGAGSRRGLESALADERFDNLYQVESAAREAEVIAEGERHGGRNPSVDALMAQIRAQGAASITPADVAFTGRERGGSADRTREIMDFIEQIMGSDDISHGDASGILEMMMAEDSYPEDMEMEERIAATLYDSSGRFIVGLSSVDPTTRIREVSVALRNRIRGRASRAELAADMMAQNSEPAQTFGPVDMNAPFRTIDGHEFDMRTLTKMYIITGGGATAQGTGAVELPIGAMTSAFRIHNLVYRDGALIGTMENGCRGNLVVIPVDRQYVRYVPPVVVRTPQQPATPGMPETPEVGQPFCRPEEGCDGTNWVRFRVCYDAHGQLISKERETILRYNASDCGYEPPSDGNGDGDGDGCGGCDGGQSGAAASEGTGNGDF